MIQKALISLSLILLSACAFSQDIESNENTPVAATGDESRADRLFFDKNYDAAKAEYLMILEERPEDAKINFNLGLCYLNSDFEKIKAVQYFEKILFYDEEAATVYYLLGKCYQYDHQFDRAIDMFNKYIQYYSMGSEFTVDDAKIEIEYCENAYELMKFPVACTYENLGPGINSEYPDYFPFVSVDEGFLAYTSKRNDGSIILPDGTYASNIYYSSVKDGEYQSSTEMPGAENKNEESEVVVGMNGDGSKMLLMKGLQGISGDIYEANFSNGVLSNETALGKGVNSRYREIAATYNVDGDIIYFVSDRPGGYGGTDIWITKKLPTGAWGVPFNAGSYINTDRDEDFPNVSPDGKMLYFSSKGHFSMGGFDIFKAEFNADSNKFMSPRNLGYPVNSVDDDMNYRVSRSGRYGYISALREEGYGDYDIYRLTVNEVETEYTVLKGILTSTDERRVLENVAITVTNLKDGDAYGYYAPNPNTMRYVIVLPPGDFDVFIEAPGFEPVSYEVKVLGKSSFQPEVDKDIKLLPKG
ncbi:MAG: tetratricopeptide repeat protein [Salibacteraceae bacterium]|nr:tetratricopeptide repeat protein [Salibacteraceae bacterium]